jgi:transposase
MSTSELKRAGVLARVAAETLTLKSAAVLMEVSYRQAKRLYGRYRARGAKGLKHRSAGRASNRAAPRRLRTRALTLIREKYSGGAGERFGPTLAAEHLASEDGVMVDHETLRRWMLAAGLWSRVRKRSPHRRRRERMAHFGELVQLDGSFHPWFEDRGPQSCLLTLVDDATGRSLGRFGAQETIWAAVAVLRRWIDQYGIPRALYTDWKNVYVRRPNQEERETGAEPLTQFGRMCAALGIKIIPASSPQAKGRIERNHGTHQDRLVKKLRRMQIADVESANAFLDTAYWADHNRRFAQAPASTDDFHVTVPRGVRLDQVFRLEETRTVSNDWVVRYDNRYFQIARQSHRPPARSTVHIYEAVNGAIEIRYRDRVVQWAEIPAESLIATRAATLAASQAPPPARPVTSATPPRRRPGADHPWRRAVEQFRIDQQLAADRKAYTAVNP